MLPQEELGSFESRLYDALDLVQRRYDARFTSFLDESQVYFAQKWVERNHLQEQCLFFGGCQGNLRQMLGVFPEWVEPSKEQFPIAALELLYPKQYRLSHRDFLGALMALQLRRDVIGDLMVEEGKCLAFVQESIASFLCQELHQVGRVGVKAAVVSASDRQITQDYELICGTVASLRLDALVSLLCKVSREKAAGLIAAGLVQYNYTVAVSNHLAFGETDVISVRGYGKFRVSGPITQTKKGRYHLSVLKYI